MRIHPMKPIRLTMNYLPRMGDGVGVKIMTGSSGLPMMQSYLADAQQGATAAAQQVPVAAAAAAAAAAATTLATVETAATASMVASAAADTGSSNAQAAVANMNAIFPEIQAGYTAGVNAAKSTMHGMGDGGGQASAGTSASEIPVTAAQWSQVQTYATQIQAAASAAGASAAAADASSAAAALSQAKLAAQIRLGSLDANGSNALGLAHSGIPIFQLYNFSLPSTSTAATAGAKALANQLTLEYAAGTITQAQLNQALAALTTAATQ